MSAVNSVSQDELIEILNTVATVDSEENWVLHLIILIIDNS